MDVFKIFREPDVPVNFSYLTKYIFDLEKMQATSQRISECAMEFPTINHRYSGKKSKYMYFSMMSETCPSDPIIGVAKVDLDTHVCTYLEYGKGIAGGEMTFQPKEEAIDEDDGYLMGYMHDYNRNTSIFAVYDAKTFGREPIFSVDLPTRVPYGLHG